MIFTNQLDPSWKRGHPAPRKTGKISVQSSTVDPAYFDLSIGRAALPSNTNFWRPAAIATTEQGIAPEKKRNLSNRRGVEFLLPPYRVGRDSAFGSVGDVNRKSQSGSVVLPPGAPEILLPAARPFGRQQQQQQQEEGGWSRSVELLGFGARVLALSVHSKKRELLCDRKDPFLHLTPTKLAFTVLKSGCVVAAPMVNEAILENLDEDDTRLLGSSDRGLGAAGGRLFVGGMSVYVDSNHRLVFDRDEREEEEEEEEGDEGFDDVMKSLSKSFQQFPALTLRRVLHSVLTVSTQRLLEWQAVMRLSARTADRLTKNISLSALRKTERMSRGMAAAKMTLTAGKSLVFQNLALFIVDELFLSVRVYLRERSRRKQNPYACTDWAAMLREMRQKSMGNAAFALGIWVAGTLGTVVGTLVYPARGPELLSILAETGASHVLG